WLAGVPNLSIGAPDIKVPSGEGSLDLQAPDIDLKAPSTEGKLELEGTGLKGKFKMPKFDKPKFAVSSPKAEAPRGEVCLPSAEIDLPSATVTATGEGPTLGLNADVPGAKMEGASWKLEKPSLKMPRADIKAPEVDISLPSVDVTLPQDTVDLQAPKADLTMEGETKAPEKEATKSKDGKFKMPKFGMPSFGWSSSREAKTTLAADVDVSLKEPQVTLPTAATKVDVTLPESEMEVPAFDVPLDSLSAKEDEMVKIPKFRKPKFRIRSKGKSSESDIGSNVESEISKGQITSDMTDPDTEKPAQISDALLGVKLHKPSLAAVLEAPTLDTNLSPMEVTLPKLEAEIYGPDLECKAEQEVVSGEKGIEEKENKFKSSKFKLPSFRWSPKKEAIAPSHTEEHLEGPTLSTLSGDMGSELTFPTPETQYLHVEFDTTEKDGEKVKTKKSQFTMPKISFPKIKGQKVQVSLPVLETDVSGPKQEKEGVSVQKSEKGNSGEGAGLGIKVPKVTVPALEFSKPEAKAPKTAVGISMPTGEVILPTCEEDELTLKSAAANASLSTSDIKMIPEDSLELKSPDVSVERTSSEIAVGDVEIKVEGSEGKTKMSKFQMPKVGITLSKGKGSEKDVGQSKSEVKVPQLKATVEISDIAVEAPNLEVECGTGTDTYRPEVKMTKIDSKASEADVHLPSADISIPKTDSDIQDSNAALKIKGEIKQDEDGEEKEGHFKMPKFKLPSFSWSPKKEASVKSDSGANLEDQKLGVMSSRIDTEVKGAATDEQGSGPDLDLEISAGKVEQKSPIKKPQFVMPKISLSKIKVPKSQSYSPKAEGDATLLKTGIEGDDSIKIPDIEKSHSEGTEEGAQISIKLADTKVHTLEFSRIETETSKIEMTVSSAKIDASLTPSEGTFHQADFKISSTDECNIQKTDIKLPKGEASVDLKSPDKLTESSSVVDGRKVKLEGPEGKIKMPKFQKSKFGISLTKGKGPETEISSPNIEAELPQLKVTNEIADIAVGVPASELTSDASEGIQKLGDSVKSSDVSMPKMEGDILLSTKRSDSRVNIPKTETYADVVKRSTEGHISEITVSTAELSKSHSSASETDKDSSSANHMEASARITGERLDLTHGVPEVSVRIPKLKIPRFTFRTVPIEADVLLSKVVTDPKGSSTDIEV
ncbi:AHNK protein, partial [Pardalotus punctatus]|nr:AHNK protein [Pardalotus punctatus]